MVWRILRRVVVLPIKHEVDFAVPFIDIHEDGSKSSCTYAYENECVCACAGIAHAQLFRAMLTPGNIKKLPERTCHLLKDRLRRAEKGISSVPSPLSLRSNGTIAQYVLTDKQFMPLFECFRAECIAKAQDEALPGAVPEICEIVQNAAMRQLYPLSKNVGKCLSKSHYLCDLVTALAIAYNKMGIDDADELREEARKEYRSSRLSSYGYRPTRKRRAYKNRENAESRAFLDREQYGVCHDDGESFREEITDSLISLLVDRLYEYFVQANPAKDEVVVALRILSTFFCVNPSTHRTLWDNCFIPIYNSDICSGLRTHLSADMLHTMELARINIWDDGEAARWDEPRSRL